jgi:hypothetical protein
MGSSLYLTLPAAYVRAHNLDVHDDVLWLPQDDGIKLRFNEPPQPGEASA